MTCATCAPGHRWLAVVMRLERDRNRRYWSRHAGRDLTRLLPGTPVRAFTDEGRFVHPPKPEPTFAEALASGHVIGIVERAWREGELVLADLHLVAGAERVAEAWLRFEREGRLARMAGLSVAAEAPRVPFRDADGEESEMIDAVLTLRALDLVTTPAAGGYVLRSLQPPELSTNEAHITTVEVSQ
jgi:hypothetical protein